MKPLISIILPTRNSEKYLVGCLESVKNQSYKNIEIINVDDKSKDRTKQIAEKYTKVFDMNFGDEEDHRTSQKNFGARKAKGKYLFFLDSDMEMPKNLIEECVRETEEKKLDAVRVEDLGIGISFWGKCNAFEKDLYVKDKVIINPRFVRRDIFLNLGGFDENLVFNDDLDFNERLKGFKVGHVDVRINHYEPQSYLHIIRRSFNYGKSARKYFRKNKKGRAKLYALYYPLLYLKSYKAFLKHPIVGGGFLIKKGSEYISAGIGIVLSLIK